MKPCARCGAAAAKSGELYCITCRKAVLADLRKSGYLTPRQIGHPGQGRTGEQRENVAETKFGKDR